MRLVSFCSAGPLANLSSMQCMSLASGSLVAWLSINEKEFSINLVTGSIVIQFDEQTIYDGRDDEKDLV